MLLKCLISFVIVIIINFLTEESMSILLNILTFIGLVVIFSGIRKNNGNSIDFEIDPWFWNYYYYY